MKALVIGGSGLVGGALLKSLRRDGFQALGTYHSHPRDDGIKLDIRDGAQVDDCIGSVMPDMVFLAVNTPGGVDFCEEHPEVADSINVHGVRYIAQAASRAGALLVHYSTDYIFNGAAGPYSEDAPPCPINIYGRTKLEGERLVQDLSSRLIIIRTTAVFGWDQNSRNFAMQIWERLGTGQAMTVPLDQWCNPTLADYLAEASLRLVKLETQGVYNVVGRDHMTRLALGRALAEVMGLDPGLITGVATASLGQRAPRPLRGGLKPDKLAATLGVAPPEIRESLHRLQLAKLHDKG